MNTNSPKVTENAVCDICIALEQMIDRCSVQQVLERLETVLYAKTDHIAEHWHDKALARSWERMAKFVGKATAQAVQSNVPGISMVRT